MGEIISMAAIENRLVREFKESFYRKMGYMPIVITKRQDKGWGNYPGISLEELKKMFNPFLAIYRDELLELDCRCRCREAVELRCIFIRMARDMDYSLSKIGRFLHRHHATIICNLKHFEDLMQTDGLFRDRYREIYHYVIKPFNPPSYESPAMDFRNPPQYQSQPDLLVGLLPLQDQAGYYYQ